MVPDSQTKPRLVLIDGHSLVYRAFFALPSLTDREGNVVNAAYGFTSMLLLALQEHPDYVLASFDLGGRTFRHEELAQYKATRRPTPPELSPQFPLTRDIVRAFGIPIYEIQGVEADDVIGTLARQAREQGLHSTIVTGDLDALQLVNDDVFVLTSKRGVSETVLYTPDRVRERYGLEPIQTVDLKGLVGDVSDNIPGIRGIGEKTAIKLIQEFGSVESLVENRERVAPPKIKKLLDEHWEQALLSKKMATIVLDVAGVTLDLGHGSAKDYRPDAARTILSDLGFRSLAARVPQTWTDGSAMSAPPIFAPPARDQGRLPLDGQPAEATQPTLPLESTATESVTVIRETVDLEKLIAAFASADRAGFQVITLDDVPRRGRIAALVVGLNEHEIYYVPVAHEQERCLELRNVLPRFAPSLQSAKPSKLGFNQKADYLAMRSHGIELRGADWDLLVAAYLLNSGVRSPSLEALASDVLHRSIEGREALFGSGRAATTCDQVDVMRAAAFFGERMRVMLELAPRLESELDRLGNAELFRDLEMPLVPVLAEMELAGVSIDLSYLQQVSRELYDQLQRLDQEIADVANGPINVNSPQQLARFLFEDLDLPGGRKTKSGYSTDATVLEGLRDQHPVIPKILEFRQLSKLKGTYVDALPLLVDPKTHRVHTSFNQTVAATGRLSSSDPNLQNIPIRTEVGQKVRRAFIPGRPGDVLLSADYSQIELRVLAHMTDDPVLVDAFARGEDIHARTAAEVFGIPQAQVTANQRRLAKVVNFGLFYGLSDFGLARDTGMSTEEARVFIDAYFRAYNRVREFLEGIKIQAREQGYVETLLHRRRYIQDIRSPNRMLRQGAERIAINMPVQGSAADIMKLAMIRLQSYMHQQGLASQMVLTVHDELVFEVTPGEREQLIEVVPDLMARAYPLKVPVQVDLKLGPNWQDMERVRLVAARA
ncbi:MAG: DNA polymerase I [Candidatus Rokubacteria bacterium 13_1_40CM_4_67_11]|nr:MAG: DNA polymerase I [Candidatus Rokubacteria bacterium 13_1_40CM_4_67_11]